VKKSNPRFDGDYESYQQYVRTLLHVWECTGDYDEDIVYAAWEAGKEGVDAAVDCKRAHVPQ
jgi:hypothetical protein